MLDSQTKLQPRLSDIIAAHQHREGPLLPILHDVQAEWGMIPAEAEPVIAAALNISRAELHGVVSFYHDFRDHPAGRHTLRLCRAEACQAMCGATLADAARKALGIDWHGTTSDGAVTLEPVYCLGLCACAPAAQVDGRLVGRLDTDRLTAILAEVRG
jgi:formate dehydrogenase subunit gamma